jgi:general secretion pathway protein D
LVRSKEQNESISMDRYQYMHAVGESAQPIDNTILMRNLGSPMLPPLTNGQPPAGDNMATMPPPAPVAPRPGAATGMGTTQPVSPGQQRQQPQPDSYRPASPTQK